MREGGPEGKDTLSCLTNVEALVSTNLSMTVLQPVNERYRGTTLTGENLPRISRQTTA